LFGSDQMEKKTKKAYTLEVAAYEFGTASMTARARNKLSSQNEDSAVPIPLVPVTMAYNIA
jgi:hypothetical protein